MIANYDLVFGPEEVLEYHLELAGLAHNEWRLCGDALPVGPGIAGVGLISENRSQVNTIYNCKFKWVTP